MSTVAGLARRPGLPCRAIREPEPRLRKGQFVELEGGTQALRVFGLLNFNSIGRRLRLDFSDLFGKGYSYDRLTGSLVARDGVYRTERR